ncbi:hypothetical protein DQ04_01431020 [Trypanosoma grayi]|uniref:hypothetical protein n=1 Tax=Trypanosoma grayi TaxID=71804 RepID=UPI0004F4BBB2|nr:hypothetical protein DQ04_01431020 [Trypanosoma grayi]KEG12773.1 hypothetical protein DQ04_01431020 [Trypanosoma grayi]
MMQSDEKLPLISASASLSTTTPRRREQSQSRGSITGVTLPTINAHRADFSRTSYSNWNQQGRHNAHFRSRGDSLTMLNTTPGRTSFDPNRYLTSATARSRAIVEKFLDQLKSYHTFQPAFVEDGVYTTVKPSKRFSGASAWDTVSKVLEASSSLAVRHNMDDHFVSTLEQIPSVKEQMQPTSTRPAVVVSYHSDTTYVSGASPDDKFSASFGLWRREHPNATPEEIRQELRFWDSERVSYERAGRSSEHWYLQSELNGLVGEPLEEASSYTTSSGSRERKPHAYSIESLRERFDQRMTWEVFLVGEKSHMRKAGATSAVAAAAAGPAPAAEIITDYRKSDALHEWIEWKWRHHTHRHENAALRIQCAYRCHRAKGAAARRRYTRRIAFLESLRAEERSMGSWDTSLRLTSDELNNGGENFNAVWRSLSFVFLKLYATAMKRRARKIADEGRDREVREYAALTIQRVYRGHCGRQLAEIIRYPHLLVEKRQRRMEAAVVVVQAVWRGHRIRTCIWQMAAAVLVIQRLVRSSAARERLRVLRAKHEEDVKVSTRQFAARVVMRFLKQCVLRRREYLMRHLEQLLTLQRTFRGYASRLAMQRQQQRVGWASQLVALWGQRRFRGACGRAMAQHERSNRDARFQQLRCVDAANVIQRTWRRAQMLRSTATKTSASGAKSSERATVPEAAVVSAAVTLQRWYRSLTLVRLAKAERNATRKQLLLSEAAERILRFYRTYKSRRPSLPPQAAPPPETDWIQCGSCRRVERCTTFGIIR